MHPGNGSDRLDRIERILAAGSDRLDRVERILLGMAERQDRFDRDLQHLLTAQVVLTDRLDKLTIRLDRLGERVDRLVESQQHTEERLNALIAVVDDIVRGRPRPENP